MKFFKIVFLLLLLCVFGCVNESKNSNNRQPEVGFNMYKCVPSDFPAIQIQTDLCYKYSSKTGRQCFAEALADNCKLKE